MPKLSLKLLMKSAIPICKFECDQVEPMLKTTILMMLATLFLAGCGTFKHLEQTYYVQEVVDKDSPQTKPHFRAQVVPTVTSSHVPLFYYSRKWGAPYTIQFSGNSRSDVCTYFLLHAFKLTSDNKLVEEKRFPSPLRLDLCGSTLGFRNNHPLYRHKLDDSFQFIKGRQVELEVQFERPDGKGVETILLKGKGEEASSNTSLFSAYMGV